MCVCVVCIRQMTGAKAKNLARWLQCFGGYIIILYYFVAQPKKRTSGVFLGLVTKKKSQLQIVPCCLLFIARSQGAS